MASQTLSAKSHEAPGFNGTRFHRKKHNAARKLNDQRLAVPPFRPAVSV